MRITAVILAAGSSSRMGAPKQLLAFGDHNFLEQVYMTASEVFGDAVLIVLGAYAEQIRATLPALAQRCAVNEEWQRGMGCSISFAVRTVISKTPDTDGILFMTVDQPYITPAILQELVSANTTTQGGIAAAAYDGTAGIPALFTRTYFSDLLSLDGEQGAKKIIAAAAEHVVLVNISKAAIDIDTPEQYRSAIGNK